MANQNLILGVKWRNAFNYSEDNNHFNGGMYGSQLGRSTHKPIPLEILQHYIKLAGKKGSIKMMMSHLVTTISWHPVASIAN